MKIWTKKLYWNKSCDLQRVCTKNRHSCLCRFFWAMEIVFIYLVTLKNRCFRRNSVCFDRKINLDEKIFFRPKKPFEKRFFLGNGNCIHLFSYPKNRCFRRNSVCFGAKKTIFVSKIVFWNFLPFFSKKIFRLFFTLKIKFSLKNQENGPKKF